MNIEFFTEYTLNSLRNLLLFDLAIGIKDQPENENYIQWVSPSIEQTGNFEYVNIHCICKSLKGEFYNSKDSHNGGSSWSAKVYLIDRIEFNEEKPEIRLLVDSCFGIFIDDGGHILTFVPPGQQAIVTTQSKELKFYYLLNNEKVDATYFLYSIN